MNKYFAEFIGTYGLVFFGTGAIVVNEVSGGQIGHLGIAVVFGFIVMAMVYSFGNLSGAHINPAVTIAFWISGRFKTSQLAPYIGAQLLGAICASASLLLLFPEATTLGETVPQTGPMPSLLLEIIMSFFLMLVILYVSTGSLETGTIAGLAIGATVLLEAAMGGPISGASMNPARSIGPAIMNRVLIDQWIYIVAPIAGMALAVLAHRFFKEQ